MFFSRCTVFYTYKCISNTYTYISVGDKDQTVSNTTLTPQAQLVKTNLDIDFYRKIHHTILGFYEDPVTSSQLHLFPLKTNQLVIVSFSADSFLVNFSQLAPSAFGNSPSQQYRLLLLYSSMWSRSICLRVLLHS